MIFSKTLNLTTVYNVNVFYVCRTGNVGENHRRSVLFRPVFFPIRKIRVKKMFKISTGTICSIRLNVPKTFRLVHAVPIICSKNNRFEINLFCLNYNTKTSHVAFFFLKKDNIEFAIRTFVVYR